MKRGIPLVLQPYIRKAHYYETDQMGIIHHSNYLRWFEEARVDLMDQVGFGYKRMEEEGLASPVLEFTCTYQSMVRFGDTVRIWAVIKAFTGAKMVVGCRVEDLETGELRTVGESKHCFVDRNGKPVSVKRVNPQVFALFRQYVCEE